MWSKDSLLNIIAGWGLTFLIIAILFILSAVPLDMVGLGDIRPSFLLIAIYYMTLLRPSSLSLLFVFALGLALDLLSSAPLGLNAFTFVSVQWMVRSQRKFMIGQSFKAIWAGFAFVAFVSGIFQLLVISAFNMEFYPPWTVLISALVSTALFPLLASPLSLVHKSLDEEI